MLALAGFFWLSTLSSAVSPNALATYSLVDALVWDANLKMDVTTYVPGVQAQIEQLRQRSEAYRSKRIKPTGSSELGMVYGAQVRYERRLVAASTWR